MPRDSDASVCFFSFVAYKKSKMQEYYCAEVCFFIKAYFRMRKGPKGAVFLQNCKYIQNLSTNINNYVNIVIYLIKG